MYTSKHFSTEKKLVLFLLEADLEYVERMKDLLHEQGDVGGNAHVDQVLPVQLQHARDVLASHPLCAIKYRVKSYSSC